MRGRARNVAVPGAEEPHGDRNKETKEERCEITNGRDFMVERRRIDSAAQTDIRGQNATSEGTNLEVHARNQEDADGRVSLWAY